MHCARQGRSGCFDNVENDAQRVVSTWCFRALAVASERGMPKAHT